MFIHTLKLSLRSLWRSRLYSLLNLLGLATGMAAAMLIALWVQNELRFDRYHERSEHLWRINTDLKISADETWHWGNTPLNITQLCEKVAGISASTQLLGSMEQTLVVQTEKERFGVDKFGYVSSNWFEVFDYEFAEGSAAGFGRQPHELMLTESLAYTLFGKEHAKGKTLRIDSVNYTVYAVLRDNRSESSFRHELLMPVEAHLSKKDNRTHDAGWENFNYTTFVEVNPALSPVSIAEQLTRELQAAKSDSNITLKLAALTDLHFDQSLTVDDFEKGNKRSVAIFILVGSLILCMAAINYVSLATARAQSRAREVGIQKMVGAGIGQLFGRFLYESVLLIGLSGLLAMAVVQAVLPWFEDISGHNFRLVFSERLPWLLLGGSVTVCIVLAGIYPALALARFRPLKALRSATGGVKRSWFRQGLVVTQFAIAVTLLFCTLVISEQRAYISRSEMGYDREHVFSFQMGWRLRNALGPDRIRSIGQQLRNESSIADVALANGSPVHIISTHSGSVKFNGLPEDAHPTVSQISADPNFARLFNLEMAEGRWFEADKSEDLSHVVLNESAARQLGLPQPWVGQRFGFQGQEGQVIGIVKDFHFLPLREKISPLVINNYPNSWGYFFIKTQPGKAREAVAAAERIWKEVLPAHIFAYAFLEDDFDRMYRTEQQAGVLFNCFAGIAIFISCLGLFGLAVFVAMERTKEIGIRKVLGASVASVVALLSADFLKLVLVAILIASPLAGYLMHQWLQDFAYRIELQWWMFVAAGMAAVTIAFLTVSAQSVKAALAHPVKSLRSE